jgi:hypothetical protein
VEAVVNRYLFEVDDIAQDILERFFTCKYRWLEEMASEDEGRN